MDIAGRNALVLGGHGLVGMAVCRALLAERPAVLVVASRRRNNAAAAVDRLRADHPASTTSILPAWGDVFLRASPGADGDDAGATAVDDADRRRQSIADFLDPLDENIVESSRLTQIITGAAPGLGGSRADIVVDCMNTATAIGYENLYSRAASLWDAVTTGAGRDVIEGRAEMLLASLYIPRLVRHMQILHAAMRRAGTQAYVKVGTSGTGGMGLDVPYTHGEERPSRLLMSKAALAGAQTLLTFLMARTSGGPHIVKEIKPAAVVGWREIAFGPIRRGGRPIPLHDCLPENAVPLSAEDALRAGAPYGFDTGNTLTGVYIDTGENGQFSEAEFSTITALGQMEMVTAEEIGQRVVGELRGENSGKDVIAGLDASVSGPSYRGGFLRQSALDRLRRLEAEHGEAVAFEILGPPRLSKLLFEAHLLKRACKSLTAAIEAQPDALAAAIEADISSNAALRQRILSIGVPILLRTGDRLLRGPVVKADKAEQGWVDCTADNIRLWQSRLVGIREMVRSELDGDTSSRRDRNFQESYDCGAAGDAFDIGPIVAWIFSAEDRSRRLKD